MARQFVQVLDKWLQKVTFQLFFANAMYLEDGFSAVQCNTMSGVHPFPILYILYNLWANVRWISIYGVDSEKIESLR